jgi:hypothetical protein
MSGNQLSRHVVHVGNRVLGERFCQSCRRHHKIALFDDDSANCRVAKARMQKARDREVSIKSNPATR